MAKDEKTNVDFQIATTLGALTNAVDRIEQDVREFKTEYHDGKQAAKKHAEWQKQEIYSKVNRDELPVTLKMEWVIANRKFVVAVIAIAISIGILNFGPKAMKWAKENLTIEAIGK